MQFAATKQDENGNNKRAVIITPQLRGFRLASNWTAAQAIADELGLVLEGPVYLSSKTNAGD